MLFKSGSDTKTGDGYYDRNRFESYFNGYNIHEKSECYKIYFMDSCREYIDSELIDGKNDIIIIKW